MDLKTYLKTHKQVELARVLGVTQGAVHQWANGLTAVAIERCVPIERATGAQSLAAICDPTTGRTFGLSLQKNRLQRLASKRKKLRKR